MGFSPRRPGRTNSHFLNVLRTLWWSYNGPAASESPLGNTGKKDQPPRLQKAILLHLCSLCAQIFRPPRAKQYKRDQLLSLHTSRLFERLNDPLQLELNMVMFCADLAAFPSFITAVHLFHKASTARTLRRFVPQLQHLQVLLETNKPICHLRGNREYFCHSEHPVFLLQDSDHRHGVRQHRGFQHRLQPVALRAPEQVLRADRLQAAGGRRRNQPCIQWPGLVNKTSTARERKRRTGLTPGMWQFVSPPGLKQSLTLDKLFFFPPQFWFSLPTRAPAKQKRAGLWFLQEDWSQTRHSPLNIDLNDVAFQFETVKIPDKTNVPVMSVYIIFVWQRSSAKHFSRNWKKRQL